MRYTVSGKEGTGYVCNRRGRKARVGDREAAKQNHNATHRGKADSQEASHKIVCFFQYELHYVAHSRPRKVRNLS